MLCPTAHMPIGCSRGYTRKSEFPLHPQSSPASCLRNVMLAIPLGVSARRDTQKRAYISWDQSDSPSCACASIVSSISPRSCQLRCQPYPQNSWRTIIQSFQRKSMLAMGASQCQFTEMLDRPAITSLFQMKSRRGIRTMIAERRQKKVFLEGSAGRFSGFSFSLERVSTAQFQPNKEHGEPPRPKRYPAENDSGPSSHASP